MGRKSSVRVFALRAHLVIRLGMDYVKNVVNPIRMVAPRDSIRGFVDDFYNITEDVLFLEGEIHYERKPVSGLSDALDYMLRCVIRQACCSRLRLQETSLRAWCCMI